MSRGDDSGTHQKEGEIWRAAGRTPPASALIVKRAFMTASMRRANAEGAYFLTDSSTWIAERTSVPRLKLLLRGGEMLANPYHTLYATPPTVGAATARRFGAFLRSPRAQQILREFGCDRFGEAMYHDAAGAAALLR